MVGIPENVGSGLVNGYGSRSRSRVWFLAGVDRQGGKTVLLLLGHRYSPLFLISRLRGNKKASPIRRGIIFLPPLSLRAYALQELAPVAPEKPGLPVAGFHRASPSTTLDKSF
jgi:hypothetical protein